MNRYELKDRVWLNVAATIAELATCPRRKVGCVLTSKTGHVLSTGYNGPASGQPHCTAFPCPGAAYPSGQGLEFCEAVHAEINALIQCRNHLDIGTAYVTTFPCLSCIKALLNTSCSYIVYRDLHPHTDEAMRMWCRSGKTVKRITKEDLENVHGL